MKKLLSTTLLILLCVITSQATAQNDSIQKEPEYKWFLKSAIIDYKPLVLQPEQVFYIYVGLQQRCAYKKRFHEAQAAIFQQNDLIQSQNEEIKSYAREEIESSKELAKLNADLVKKSEEIQIMKDKKSKWYKSPFLYAGLGFAVGVYIAK